MWPVLLDMTKDESMQGLRNLELQAYSYLVSALRAQGPLNPDKRKLLKETGQILNIPQDRHKAEVRRAINDERLNTIAYHVTGFTESVEDWAQEGRRTVPLIPRMAPQTAYSAIADEAAETATIINKQLPPPACTERKRPSPQSVQLIIPEQSKQPGILPFRVPETPKNDESAKKRKLCPENSSLAQHLLGPPKMNRTQAIYRQRAKALLKDHAKMKPQQIKVPFSPHANNGLLKEETLEQIQNEVNSYMKQSNALNSSELQMQANENQAPPRKLITPTKTFQNINLQKSAPGPSNSQQILNKLCKKTIAKPLQTTTTSLGQKLIVVSNAQTITTNSILQKNLSIPLVKNISVKNLDKFKIVTSTPPQIVQAANVNNLNSIKHKVVTVKTNPTTKKVIPLSLLNSKGTIKVLPIGGKIVGKSTTTTTTSPLYIVSTIGGPTAVKATTSLTSSSTQPASSVESELVKENGKSSVLGDILKASGVTSDDFDSQITEFRIPNPNLSENEQAAAKEQEIIESSNDEVVIECEDNNSTKEIDEVVATVVEQIVNISSDVVDNSELLAATTTTAEVIVDNMEVMVEQQEQSMNNDIDKS